MIVAKFLSNGYYGPSKTKLHVCSTSMKLKKMKDTKGNLWNQKPQIENDVLWIWDYFALIRKESGSAFI